MVSSSRYCSSVLTSLSTKWIQRKVYSVHTIQWKGLCRPRSTKSEARVETMTNSHRRIVENWHRKPVAKLQKLYIKSSHGSMIHDTRVEGRYAATGLYLNLQGCEICAPKNLPKTDLGGLKFNTNSRVKPCETWTTPELRCRASFDFYGQLQGDDGTMGP